MAQNSKKYVKITCPTCGQVFGQEKRFLQHHIDAHGSPASEELYLAQRGIEAPLCKCGCGERLPWKGWKKGYDTEFIRFHNGKLENPFMRRDVQLRSAAKRAEGYRTGKYRIWCEGKSAETDERLAAAAEKKSATLREGYDSGRITSWQKGLTKETDGRIAARALSAKKTIAIRGGPWNTGLTKEADPRLARLADSVSRAYVGHPEMGRRIKREELQQRIHVAMGDRFTLVSDLSGYRRSKLDRLQFRCTQCGEIQEKSLDMIEATPVCFNCHPKESRAQLEIFHFVRDELGFSDAESCNRTVIAPQELDIWVPSKRLGIEHDGLYWHSEKAIADKTYHEKKVSAAHAAGISYLEIFEDEWANRQELVKSMIRHRLGLSSVSVPARKCAVRELSVKERQAFFSANHLEGDVRSTVAFGLVSPRGEIVAAMSLRRAFHRRYADWAEVGRSCCCPGASVPGWVGRLSKRCIAWAREQGKEGLITYADRRVGTGESYIKAGFRELKATTGPRLWWTDGEQRLNRFAVKADKARGVTQKQACAEAGVWAFWSPGNRLMAMDA